MSQDCVFDQRWEFRRKESDLDSSSEDKGSSSARDQKLQKCDPLLNLVPAEDEEEETSHNRELAPLGAENQPNQMENTQDKRIKKNKGHRRGPRVAKTMRGSKKIEHGQNVTTALHGLETHMNGLVKELNTCRAGFMKWMADELDKLIPDSASASPSKSTKKGKSRQGQETKKRKASKRGEPSEKTLKVNGRSSKKLSADNGSSKVAVEQNKAQDHVEEAQEAEEAANLPIAPTVLRMADNNKARQSGMLMPAENTNRAYIASNYLNLPNLNPRPLAENYLVKPSSSTVRLQPVTLESHRDALSAQQQSAAYYQGVTRQSARDFSRPDMCSMTGFDRSYGGPLSGPLGSQGGFPSTGHLGLKGGFNIHSMGLSGLEAPPEENNFPSLRMMSYFGGGHGDMNTNHLKYSSLREN